MNESPLVSVVIPAYDQAAYLGEAIRSVLNQTYTNLELIVVDDCSPDNTAEMVRSFSDPRLYYIRHDHNQQLPAARNTGICSTRGELIALLDADDYFNKNKLALHVQFLQRNADVSISYGSCGKLRCSNQQLRNLTRPPATVSLADLVMGFPFSPSDMVLRREAAFSIGLYDARYIHGSEDLDFNCRLALAGWRFGGIDRCLTYRRIHAGRVIHNPRQRLAAALQALQQTFASPDTPAEVLGLKERAFANHYVVWGVEALRGHDTDAGVEFLREALRCRPALVEGHPNELTRFLVYESAHDDTIDLNAVYHNLVQQLPDEFASVKQQAQWGMGRAWLVDAYRHFIWGSIQQGRRRLEEAARLHAVCDEDLVGEVVHQLLGLELEEGRAAADKAARRLDEQLAPNNAWLAAPSFVAALETGRVFEYFNAGYYSDVPVQALRAAWANPQRAVNRGSLSIALQAAIRSRRRSNVGARPVARKTRTEV